MRAARDVAADVVLVLVLEPGGIGDVAGGYHVTEPGGEAQFGIPRTTVIAHLHRSTAP